MDTNKIIILLICFIPIVFLYYNNHKSNKKIDKFTNPKNLHPINHKKIDNTELINIINYNKYKYLEDETYMAYNNGNYYNNRIKENNIDETIKTLDHINLDKDFTKKIKSIDLNKNKKILWKKLNDVARPWYINTQINFQI